MARTLGELNFEMTERRKVFREVDELAMKLGLEETLKYLINVPAVEFTVNIERAQELKQMYSQVSRLAQNLGINTQDYDLTFSRQLKEHTQI